MTSYQLMVNHSALTINPVSPVSNLGLSIANINNIKVKLINLSHLYQLKNVGTHDMHVFFTIVIVIFEEIKEREKQYPPIVYTQYI